MTVASRPIFLKDKTMARIPTRLVTILDGTKRVMFINESDYDAEFHELMDGLPEPTAATATEPTATATEPTATPTEPTPEAPNAATPTEPTPEASNAATPTEPTGPHFSVREGDDKFFVVNENDEPTGNGFDTFEEAETLVKTLNDLTD